MARQIKREWKQDEFTQRRKKRSKNVASIIKELNKNFSLRQNTDGIRKMKTCGLFFFRSSLICHVMEARVNKSTKPSNEPRSSNGREKANSNSTAVVPKIKGVKCTLNNNYRVHLSADVISFVLLSCRSTAAPSHHFRLLGAVFSLLFRLWLLQMQNRLTINLTKGKKVTRERGKNDENY